jgi:ferric-dicitrate binding protein FerR (iron transport regulator)
VKNFKYSKIEAFVFKLWLREVSVNKLEDKEKEILHKWRIDADQDLDPAHIRESKERVLSVLQPYFAPALDKQRKHFFRKHIYQAAAVLVLLFSLGGSVIYKNFFMPDVYTAESSIRKVILKDGSLITLLPGAELTVDKSFPSDTRIVDLRGDAVFSVAKSKFHPFIVRAENFSTKVLGTVFKISQSGKNKAVDLYEGKVAVSYAGVPVSYLKPNQVWTNFGIARTAAVYTKNTDTQSGRKSTKIESLNFNEVPFSEIIEVVKKHYGINILYPAEIGTKKISAELKGNIDENIEVLAFAVGMEVQKDNNTYTLKK